MVKIFLNNMKYRYEVYHVIKLYFIFDEIIFESSSGGYYNILIDKNKIVCNYSDFNEVYNIKNNIPLKEELKKAVFLFFRHLTGKDVPWGILLGIRSTKIACDLLESGYSDSDIIKYYNEHYFTAEEKSKLCIEIAKKEISHINHDSKKISIYICMPYCPTRCFYCSFASNPIKSNNNYVDKYINALIKEIKALKKFINEKGLEVECIYFGGGTPTSVNEIQLGEIMTAIYDSFYSDCVREFTVECGRPDTINIEKLNIIRRYNVTRICINPQSMNDQTLRIIGRCHTSDDIVRKYILARNMGFNDINMDIIIGLPGEGENEIKNTIESICDLLPESVTVHGLCIKRGSKLHEYMLNNNDFKAPEQEVINNMYNIANNSLRRLGLSPYYLYKQKNMVGNMENIGYAKEDCECLYNIEMMQEKQSIIALGADGVSKIYFKNENRLERFANLKDVKEYVSRIDEMIKKKIDFFTTLYK